MSFEYKPVFLEEYNQTLRDSVNTYYTHAMNDPKMPLNQRVKWPNSILMQFRSFKKLRKLGILKQLMKMCQSLIMVWMALMIVWIFKKEI